MKHALLSASSSEKWINCPGSISAEKGIPEKRSSFAEEGTAAHELAEMSLESGLHTTNWLNEFSMDCAGIKFDSEMCDYVQVYVDYVRSIAGNLLVEERVDFSEWVPAGFGTSDAIVIIGDTLHVIDLKYGKGIKVFAEQNTQAMLYALGAYSLVSDLYDIKKISISIVQPRFDHIDNWELSIDDLMKFGVYVSEKAHAALTPDAERVPGDKQCQWCKAKATCPALEKLTKDTVINYFDNELETLNDDRLRKALDNKKLIQSWLDAVETLVKDRLLAGDIFEGYKIVEGRATRNWINESDASAKLVEFLNLDDIYVSKLISPAQAEKKLGKTKSKEIESVISKSSGSPALVKDSDKRQSINITINDFD